MDGTFDDALRWSASLPSRIASPICLVNSLNPYRIEGQKSAAFEVCDVWARAPDWLCLPVGNAGNITAYWAGFRAIPRCRLADGLPRMLGFQAAGAAPLVLGHAVDKPETVATAIRIGGPARASRRWPAAEIARPIMPSATTRSWRLPRLARMEGHLVEPASAAGLAGIRRLAREGRLDRGATIVCVSPGTASRTRTQPRRSCRRSWRPGPRPTR